MKVFPEETQKMRKSATYKRSIVNLLFNWVNLAPDLMNWCLKLSRSR